MWHIALICCHELTLLGGGGDVVDGYYSIGNLCWTLPVVLALYGVHDLLVCALSTDLLVWLSADRSVYCLGLLPIYTCCWAA